MRKLKEWAKQLKRQIFILYYAYKQDQVPWYAKLFAVFVVAYAFSPIDLIPDFIPVLGFLDEVILLPIGIYVALKMIPKDILVDCEEKATNLMKQEKPKNWVMGSLILFLWSVVILWATVQGYQFLENKVL